MTRVISCSGIDTELPAAQRIDQPHAVQEHPRRDLRTQPVYMQRKAEGFAPEVSSFNVNNSSLGLNRRHCRCCAILE